MPASKLRTRQPVTEVTNELGALVMVPVLDKLLIKSPNGKSLKDMTTKEEKIQAIGDSIRVTDSIQAAGTFNVILIDDLFDTGASMETACRMLGTYMKIEKVFVAALTWTRL